MDGSIVRAHQHSAGAAADTNEVIGKSRGGNSTKIHLTVDSGGLPIYFESIIEIAKGNELLVGK